MNRVISISNLLARAGRRGAAERNRTRLSLMILAVVGVLLVVGLGATMSASSVEGILENSDRLAVFKRQVRWVAVGRRPCSPPPASPTPSTAPPRCPS